MSLSFFSRKKRFPKQLEQLSYNDIPVLWEKVPRFGSLHVAVLPSGTLKVKTRKSAKQSEVLQFLEENQTWVEQSLVECQKLRDRFPKKQFVEDESFMFQGYDYKLKLQQKKVSRPQFSLHSPHIILESDLSFPLNSKDYYFTRLELRKFYRKQGVQVLRSRLKIYSEAMGLFPSKLSFRCQKTRWGSCSSDGSISLNWRLIATPLAILDYVVVHELAHLMHPDHSKQFWSLVERFCPFQDKAKNWLKQYHFCVDFLAYRSELYPDDEKFQ